jgi:hypothetical protein
MRPKRVKGTTGTTGKGGEAKWEALAAEAFVGMKEWRLQRHCHINLLEVGLWVNQLACSQPAHLDCSRQRGGISASSRLLGQSLNDSPHSRAVATGGVVSTNDFQAATRDLPCVNFMLHRA